MIFFPHFYQVFANNIITLLTDLSKAFDCLPHKLLITKLKPYGVCDNACMLISSYFQERYQRVKVGNSKSQWMELDKGCPQGSLLGPLAYNIFSNDLLILMENVCDIYNYADDNSVGCYGKLVEEVVGKLKTVASVMLEWFQDNYLQANPEKFQFIVHGTTDKSYLLQINNNVCIPSVDEVKLLGVTIDSGVNFSKHIDNLQISFSYVRMVSGQLPTS